MANITDHPFLLLPGESGGSAHFVNFFQIVRADWDGAGRILLTLSKGDPITVEGQSLPEFIRELVGLSVSPDGETGRTALERSRKTRSEPSTTSGTDLNL